MSDDAEKRFLEEEAREIMRGKIERVSSINLTVGMLRRIMGRADRLGITAVEIEDTKIVLEGNDRALPLRFSIRQLRPFLEVHLKDAEDTDLLDLELPGAGA